MFCRAKRKCLANMGTELFDIVPKKNAKIMKLRVKHNSIRLRLTQREVARLAETGRVEEEIEFGAGPQQQFIYALENSVDENEISAVIDGRRITVFVPQTTAETWINSDDTGIEAEQNTGGGKTLRILIEKDFACLKPRKGEDEQDAFPHLSEGKVC